MVAGDFRGRSLAVDALDACDVVIVQHEYGIYGGSDGDEVLQVLDSLSAPAIVVLHTVLRSPTPGQRMVLERICALAGAVVVMTGTAARLLGGYAVPMEKVRVIPHGVAPRPHAEHPPHGTAAGAHLGSRSVRARASSGPSARWRCWPT